MQTICISLLQQKVCVAPLSHTKQLTKMRGGGYTIRTTKNACCVPTIVARRKQNKESTMKRTHQLLAFAMILCLTLSVGIFTACGEHEHTYSDEYQSDDTNHWQVCTECGENSTATAHVDTNGDEKCDVCGKKLPHVHSYTKYVSDDIRHWLVCPKDNKIDESSKGDHVDSDNDRKCDICEHHVHGHVLDTEHFTAEKHGYVCPDKHDGDSSWLYSENHTDADGDGKCDVCGYDMSANS